jgi:2-polyprenyl-6-methoxyphenol hydroxylase-like FAD-dependent oxidoreductase
MGDRQPEALIIGASYAGLVAAAALRANHWRVNILERSTERLRTGGGVVVQRRMMEYLTDRGLGLPDITGIPAHTRKIFQPDGTTLSMPETAAAYTSWDVLLRQLEDAVGESNIQRGVSMVEIPDWGFSGDVVLSDGTTRHGDVIIAADGIGSHARQQLLPGIVPTYAGYIAWRGMVEERELTAETIGTFADSLSSCPGKRTVILLYEIPGVDGSVEPGNRRINWVWYENVPSRDELQDILTDSQGIRHRSTMPRGLMREDIKQRMHRTAVEELPRPFAEVVMKTEEPFVQTIDDLTIPRLVFGRVVLIGDAASLVRPHIGSGTAKAVDDAILLAHALSDGCDEDLNCLAAWEYMRLEVHAGMAEYSRAVARRLGLGQTPSSATNS